MYHLSPQSRRVFKFNFKALLIYYQSIVLETGVDMKELAK